MKNPLNYVGVQLILVGTFCVIDAASILFHPAKRCDTPSQPNNVITSNKQIRHSPTFAAPSAKNNKTHPSKFYLQTTEHRNH